MAFLSRSERATSEVSRLPLQIHGKYDDLEILHGGAWEGTAPIIRVASCVASRRLATTGFPGYFLPRRLKTCGYQNKKRTDALSHLKRYHSAEFTSIVLTLAEDHAEAELERGLIAHIE